MFGGVSCSGNLILFITTFRIKVCKFWPKYWMLPRVLFANNESTLCPSMWHLINNRDNGFFSLFYIQTSITMIETVDQANTLFIWQVDRIMHDLMQ